MRRVKLYLPYAAWPEEDRTLWEAAFTPGTDLFDDCGSAAHLAERTRLHYSMRMGNFSPSSRLVTVSCSAVLLPNGSIAKSSKTMSNGNQRPAEA